MNETLVLVARLDSAGLDSPAPAPKSNSPRPTMTLTSPSSPSLRTAGANSTFAVSEPMDMEDERAGEEQGQLASLKSRSLPRHLGLQPGALELQALPPLKLAW